LALTSQRPSRSFSPRSDGSDLPIASTTPRARSPLDAGRLSHGRPCFESHGELFSMLQEADAGRARTFLPAVVVAEAETMLWEGYDGWGCCSSLPVSR
jgi:hypothetical protein